MNFKVYIPARHASTRLPGKVLQTIGGRTMLELVHARARASGAAEVVIATDDERVARVAEGFGASVCMTGAELQSGSDRIAAAAALRGEADTQVIVNLQGDEPFMPAAVIAQVASVLARGDGVDIATVCEPLREAVVLGVPLRVDVALGVRLRVDVALGVRLRVDVTLGVRLRVSVTLGLAVPVSEPDPLSDELCDELGVGDDDGVRVREDVRDRDRVAVGLRVRV